MKPPLAAGPIQLNRQNGLFEQSVTITNPTPYTFLAVRQSLVYTVQGGDFTSRPFRIDVPTQPRLSLVRAQQFWSAVYLATEHRDLFDVIASGDADAADQRLHEHLRLGRDQILADLPAG